MTHLTYGLCWAEAVSNVNGLDDAIAIVLSKDDSEPDGLTQCDRSFRDVDANCEVFLYEHLID